MDRFFGNDRDAVVVFKRGDIVFEETNRNFDGDGRAVVDEHEALQPRMAVVVGADARNDQRCRVGRGVLFFGNNEAVKGEKSGRELRAARAVFAPKQFVGAIAVYSFEKICERREARIASAAVVERACAHKGEFSAMRREFIDLAVIELKGADELRRGEECEAAFAQPAVCGEARDARQASARSSPDGRCGHDEKIGGGWFLRANSRDCRSKARRGFHEEDKSCCAKRAGRA